MTRGKLITFEGGEGSGKSTQASHLVAHLGGQGIEAVLTREPGGVPFAERLRELILAKRPSSPNTEFLLFAAARCEHIADLIEPVLSLGQWVVCDRYIDSTRVYQGRLAGIDPELIAMVEQKTVAPVFPDLTFILDVNPRIGLERARARGELSRYDAASDAAHANVRQGFLDLAAAEPKRCVVLAGCEAEMELAGQIAAVVDRRFLGQG
ncbi:MAG: thymidylate kinase [Alphaproteobacteria bacterium BRH_c36]|nr:MAG: thymidylate kinase [Alphaproteobacteria bacterium BRH_c36]